jgi:hypothetical protein
LRREGGDKELTRMRWVSGVSLEVMWSAILLWEWEWELEELGGERWWFDAGVPSGVLWIGSRLAGDVSVVFRF